MFRSGTLLTGLRFIPQERERLLFMTDFETELLLVDRRTASRRRRAETNSTPTPADVTAEAPSKEDHRAKEDHREVAERRRLDRRRQIDPTTCERDYSVPEIEFMRAMDDYKRRSGRPFPTWSEVLEVITSLGYRKVAEPAQMAWRTFGDH